MRNMCDASILFDKPSVFGLQVDQEALKKGMVSLHASGCRNRSSFERYVAGLDRRSAVKTDVIE